MSQDDCMIEYDEMIPKAIPDIDDADPAVTIQARITSIATLNSEVVELVLVLDQSLIYHADQNSLFFVPYHPAKANVQGSYSFAHGDVPGIVNMIHFHIRKVPGLPFPVWLFDGNKTGEQVVLEGPFGSFARIRPLTPSSYCRRTAGELGLCVRPVPMYVE